MKRKGKTATKAALNRLDRPVKAWLLDDPKLLEHGDAIMFLLDGLEDDFRRWWALHRPGEPYQDPYEWWLRRDAERE